MKKAIFLLPLLLLVSCAPASSSESSLSSGTGSSSASSSLSSDPAPTLGKVADIVYEDGLLTYGEVEGATGYEVRFEHRGEIVYEDTVTGTAIDVMSLGLAGTIDFSIRAVADGAVGPYAELSFEVLATFGEVVFEAENYLYNFGTGKESSNFRNNPLASNGAYVGGIDDAGQGIYIDYLSPKAGTFEFVLYYTTDMAPARNEVWVNGECQATFLCEEKTGWGASGWYSPVPTSVEIELEAGWNSISVMKNGDSSNNWGSFVEMDYLVLKGDGSAYNPDDLLQYGERPVYRLEAEMGSPRKKNVDSGLNTAKNPAIVEDAVNKYSNGFLLGGIEQNYDGVEWHFYSPVAATYSINVAYAAGEFGGSKLPKPSFIVTQEAVGLSRNADFNNYEAKTIDGLSYTGWNHVEVSETSVEIELEQGDNYIYCLLLNSVESGFFQLDYCDLTFVSETAGQ